MSKTNLLSTSHDWHQVLTIRRSTRARYARFRVYPGGQVELVLPHRFNESDLPGILAKHEPWILRTLKRLGAKAQAPQAVAAPERIHLPAIEHAWEIDYLAGEDSRYGCRELASGVLRISGGTAWQPSLKRWLARKGRQHLVPWLEQISEELALPFSGATVRGQKSRWGSCSSRHHINLNYALLFLPPEWVRYLFVHELCHTVHLNHSPQYWQLVEQIEPDFRRLESKLRQATAMVPPWVHARDVQAV